MRCGGPVFDNVPVTEPVAVMNGYGRQPVAKVGDPSSAWLRVGGLLRTGDNVAFRLSGAPTSAPRWRFAVQPTPWRRLSFTRLMTDTTLDK